MKAARLVVLGVALAAGGVAALLAKSGPQTVVQPDTLEVLVTKADLGGGHVIADHDIGWQTWPTAAANAGLIKKTERPDAIQQFVGAVVRVAVASGEPLHDPMVSFVPQGMRAVSVTNTPTDKGASVFKPDEHVDVLLTSHDKQVERTSGLERLISKEILENVRVLAMATGDSVMLELTPDQAATLDQSLPLGTISLVDHSEQRWSSNITVVKFGVSR